MSNQNAINEILNVKKEYLEVVRADAGKKTAIGKDEAMLDAVDISFAIELITHAREQEAAEVLEGLAVRFNNLSSKGYMAGWGAPQPPESKKYADFSAKLKNVASSIRQP